MRRRPSKDLQALVSQPSRTEATALVSALQGDSERSVGNTYIYLSPGRRNANSFDLYSAGRIAGPIARRRLGANVLAIVRLRHSGRNRS